MFYAMQGWKLQAWRLVTALPGATINSSGPARHSASQVGQSIFSVAPQHISGGLPRITSRRASTAARYTPVGYHGPPVAGHQLRFAPKAV
ncbi:hypothetical protein AVEN_58631-1 [Araneus ventricosus]|uniref:Uncharacterized protein n=1 Tax=Araneus ventricosus TaxID=182803 RepID=A0A4Y1ZSN8_ARAVE|nr:hypothetical protein AVEN_58631-1 [Araneus ventricosus]